MCIGSQPKKHELILLRVYTTTDLQGVELLKSPPVAFRLEQRVALGPLSLFIP